MLKRFMLGAVAMLLFSSVGGSLSPLGAADAGRYITQKYFTNVEPYERCAIACGCMDQWYCCDMDTCTRRA